MIVLGIGKTLTGTVESRNCNCPECGKYSINYSSQVKYLRVFWIPTVPLRRKGFAYCDECDYWQKQKELPNSMMQEYKVLKSQLRLPKWIFSGLVILTVLILFVANLLRQDAINEKGYLAHPKVGDRYSVKLEDGNYSYYKLVNIQSDSLCFFRDLYVATNLKGLKKLMAQQVYGTDTIKFSKKDVLIDYDTGRIRSVFRSHEIKSESPQD